MFLAKIFLVEMHNGACRVGVVAVIVVVGGCRRTANGGQSIGEHHSLGYLLLLLLIIGGRRNDNGRLEDCIEFRMEIRRFVLEDGVAGTEANQMWLLGRSGIAIDSY